MNFKNWLKNENTIPMGQCFSYASQLSMEMLKDGLMKQVFVCHGMVEEPLAIKPKRYIHAWVEATLPSGEEKVYDWQMSKAKNSLSKEDFYELYKPSDIKKYKAEDVYKNLIKYNHFGPWD